MKHNIPKLVRPAKGVLKGKFIAVNTYTKWKRDFAGGPVVKTARSQGIFIYVLILP